VIARVSKPLLLVVRASSGAMPSRLTGGPAGPPRPVLRWWHAETALHELVAELPRGVVPADQPDDVGQPFVRAPQARGVDAEQLPPVRPRVERSELVLERGDDRP
jgi:hypothetical protein